MNRSLLPVESSQLKLPLITFSILIVVSALSTLRSSWIASASPGDTSADHHITIQESAQQEFHSDASARAILDLNTALRLARYGYEHNDALALMTSAQMIKRASLRRSNAQRAAGGELNKRGADRYSVRALLQRARALAVGRSELLNLITDVERSGSRGSVSGLSRAVHVVSPHTRDVFKVKFKQRELAAVLFSGDGDTNLDLYVYDAQNKLVCSDRGPTDECLCSWRPKRSEVYTIHVKNLGDTVNRYVIAHN